MIFVERQNKIIKKALVKVLDDSCALRKSAFVNKILTIFLIYNRDSVLPIDGKFSLAERELNEINRNLRPRNFEPILASGNVYLEKFMNLELLTKKRSRQAIDFD